MYHVALVYLIYIFAYDILTNGNGVESRKYSLIIYKVIFIVFLFHCQFNMRQLRTIWIMIVFQKG